MKRLRSSAVFAGVTILVACATSPGGGNGCPSGMVTLPGGAECSYACTPAATAPADPIDPGFTDDNCDGTDGVVATCLFVASDGIDSPDAGIRTAPMKTLAYALTQGKQRGMDVCLSGEIYQGEVDLVAGVSVYGGFNEHDPDFPFRREMTTTTTLTTKGTVVVANAIDVDTYLEGVVINAATADPPLTGLGTYGVRLAGGLATLYVRYDDITTGPGQDGPDGAAGAMGASGVGGADGDDGCNGCEQSVAPNPPGGSLGGVAPMSTCGGASGGVGGQGGYDQSPGNSGGNGSGSNSMGGGGGSGDSTCEVSSGGDGTVGGSPTDPGESGMDGAVPAALGTLALDGTYVPSKGGDGAIGSPGNAGGGGGGGGGGTNGGLCDGDRGAGGGSGGTGGCGGSQGTAGSGGGASFGVAAIAGKLVVGGNTMSAGGGGNGGKAGSGGPGGAGGGRRGKWEEGATTTAAGSSGGGPWQSAGGPGGNGAGGAGGPSACIATAAGVRRQSDAVEPHMPALGWAVASVCKAASGATNAGPSGMSGPQIAL